MNGDRSVVVHWTGVGHAANGGEAPAAAARGQSQLFRNDSGPVAQMHVQIDNTGATMNPRASKTSAARVSRENFSRCRYFRNGTGRPSSTLRAASVFDADRARGRS